MNSLATEPQTSELATTKFPSLVEMESMTDEELFALLQGFRRLSAKVLSVMADLWKTLVNRGHDLTPLLTDDMMRWVRKIAGGGVSAEVVYKFGNSEALKVVAKLPLAEQEQLVQDSRVEVVERDPVTRALTHRKLPVEALGKSQVKLLFDASGGEPRRRSVEEQTAILTATPIPHPEASTPRARVIITRGKLRTDGEVPVEAVIAALKEKGFLRNQ